MIMQSITISYKRVRAELAAVYGTKRNRTLDEIGEDDTAFWKLTNNVRNTPTTYPPLQSIIGICHSDREKSQAFASQLERQCTPNNSLDDDIDWDVQVVRTVFSS